jgi:hypothetical protein
MSEEKKKDPVRFVLTTRDKLFGVKEEETKEEKEVDQEYRFKENK